MLSAPTSPVAAGFQSSVVAILLLLLGYGLAAVLLGKRGDTILRAGLALPALCGYVLLLALLHLASGGALFATPWLVRGLTVSVAALCGWFLWRRRGEAVTRDVRGLGLLLASLGVGLAIWGLPVFREFPLFDPLPLEFGGDTKLHLGWTMQMLNGERLPTSPLTGDIPNYYPWFFHALLAFISDFTPGGRSFHALGPLQLVQVGGGILSFFGLGREVSRRYLGAISAATFGALSGGIGYVIARGPALEVDRDDPMSYLGDLALVRSYNPSFHNLAPTLPRELTYVLIPAFTLLLLRGMRTRRKAFFLAAGVVAGIIGLTGAEAFFLCGLVTLALGLVLRSGERIGSMLRVALPLVAVSSLWLVPTIFNYVLLGGFVNTTLVGPVRLPPAGILGAWGLVTIFAAIGIVRAVRHLSKGSVRMLLATSAAATILVVASTLAGSEGAFGVLGRAHRYWPLLHLTLVPLAAFGVTWLAGKLPWPRAAPALAGAIVLLSIPSPILGSLALSDRWLDPPEVITSAIEGEDGSPLDVLDTTAGGESCVVAVPEKLAHAVFWFSGHRVVHYRWAPYSETNLARVRWAEMSEHVPWDDERLRDNEVLLSGSEEEESWEAVADKYEVDHVLTTSAATEEGTFGAARSTRWGYYVVLSRTDCGRGG